LLTAVAAATSSPIQAQNVEQAKQDIRLRAIQLLHLPDGLHKAALANGGIFDTGPNDPPISRAAGLPDLVSASTSIVLAKVIRSKSELIDEGRDIHTVYTLQIAQTIKGQTSDQISLSAPGGSYTFSDGSKAQTEDVCKPLVQGVEYILFLMRGTKRPYLNLYYPTSPCQAVFEVGRDGRHLYSHTYAGNLDHLRAEAKNGKEGFVQRLQGIIASQQ
jgi:hypothetical protein